MVSNKRTLLGEILGAYIGSKFRLGSFLFCKIGSMIDKYKKIGVSILVLAVIASNGLYCSQIAYADYSLIQTTDSDFNSGTNSDTIVSGTGTAAQIKLGYSVTNDFGDGSDGTLDLSLGNAAGGCNGTGMSWAGSTCTINTNTKSVFNFSTINIPSSIILTFTGTNYITLKATGIVTVDGTIHANGNVGDSATVGVGIAGGSNGATYMQEGLGLGGGIRGYSSSSSGGGGGGGGFGGKGGNGGNYKIDRGLGGNTYDVENAGGSGGGGGGYWAGTGGAGGGSIIIKSGGAINIGNTGTIQSNGSTSVISGSGTRGGGGSGGRINIDAVSVVNSGSIVTDGGAGSNTSYPGAGGGGGGGRITITTSNGIINNGTVQSNGGKGGNAPTCSSGRGGSGGNGGVIVLQDSDGVIGGTKNVSGGALGSGCQSGTAGTAGNISASVLPALPYVLSGTFTSAVLDSGQISDFTTLNFSSSTPSGTTLTIDMRAGNVSTPDVSWTSWQANISNGGSLNVIDGNRYVQYRVNLATTVNSESPSLSDLTVNYLSTVAPTVLTNSVFSATSVSAIGNGSITNTGNENPTRYIQWGTTSGTYTNSCNAGTGSTGTYQCNLTNLTPNTTYYVRAYATNSGGTSYGTENSFTTLPEETIIPAPTPEDIQDALSNSYISIANGTTLDDTSEVTTNLDLTMTDTIGTITLPVNTTITNTDSGNINMEAFTISNNTTNTRSTVSTSRGSIEIGIPNTRLTFSQPISISISVGTVYNGEVLTIQSRSYNQSNWTDEGTCTVTNGICSFQTTHATTYTVNGDGTIKGETNVDLSLPIESTISLSCTDSITMNSITGTGPSTIDANNEATCNVATNNSDGYKLEWQASNADMQNSNSDQINAYTPTSINTPEPWSIDNAASEWGARLKSTSTDNDTSTWGLSDGYDGNWLNIDNSTPFEIIRRTEETTQSGSDEIIQFGAEVGSNKFQPSGTYTTTVTMTATTL